MLGLAIAGMLAAPAAVGGPIPKYDLKQLIRAEDYPASLVGQPPAGPVSVLLTVGPSGRVNRCTVLRSSGAAVLDAATCRLLVSRSRFVPAHDSTGGAIEAGMAATILWPRPKG